MARDMAPEAEATTGEFPAVAKASDTQATRERWIAELRRQGHRQCTGPMQWETGQVCAILLLSEIVDGLRWSRTPRAVAFDRAGLSEQQIDAVIAMNDGKCCRTGREVERRTFAEIADVVEGWFR